MLEQLLQGLNLFLASEEDQHISRLLLQVDLQGGGQGGIQVAVLRQACVQQLHRVLPPLHTNPPYQEQKKTNNVFCR